MIPALIAFALAIIIILFAIREEKQLARDCARREVEVLEARADAAQRGEPLLTAWTAAERDAFGIDENDEWIAKTEREIKAWEWSQIRAEIVPPRGPELTSLYAHGQVEPIAQFWEPPRDVCIIRHTGGSRKSRGHTADCYQ